MRLDKLWSWASTSDVGLPVAIVLPVFQAKSLVFTTKYRAGTMQQFQRYLRCFRTTADTINAAHNWYYSKTTKLISSTSLVCFIH